MLGNETEVLRVGDVSEVFLAQAGESGLVFGRVGEILEVLWIGLAVVKFLNRPPRSSELPLGWCHRFLFGESINLVSNFAEIRPSCRLVVT